MRNFSHNLVLFHRDDILLRYPVKNHPCF
jgi:hypothetical protein